MKTCSKCKIKYPLKYFSPNRHHNDGLQSQCKSCCRKSGREYRQTEHGKIVRKRNQQNRPYTEKDRKYGREYARKYRKTEKYKQYQRGYNQSEKGKLVQQRYRNTLNGYLRHLFKGVQNRCNNLKAGNYGRYGGRGIECRFVFSGFYQHVTIDLGYDTVKKLKGLQIDRIDNDGHYEKGNIRFVTAKENCANRRSSECLIAMQNKLYRI